MKTPGAKILIRSFFATAIVLSTGNNAFPATSFTPLGTLQTAIFYSVSADVSADGSVVVGSSSIIEGGQEAFRWNATEGMVGLGYFPNSFPDSHATGVSADGSLIVGYSESSTPESFRWTATTGMVALGNLPAGTQYRSAAGVSGDGTVIVGSYRDYVGDVQGFRWTASTDMELLGYLPGGSTVSSAADISHDGSVIVGTSRSATGNQAYRWTATTGMVGLGDLPGGQTQSNGAAVSQDGVIIVGSSLVDSGWEAFRWSEGGGMTGLGELPGGSFFSGALAVSPEGSVVFGHSITALGYEAFIWDPIHGMRLLQAVLSDTYGLDLTGWRLTDVRGVSADGMSITGSGYNPDSRREAWVVRFESPLFVPDGDINRDGSVDIADYLLAVRIALALQTPTTEQLSHGDVAPSGAPDGRIDLADFMRLSAYLVGTNATP